MPRRDKFDRKAEIISLTAEISRMISLKKFVESPAWKAIEQFVNTRLNLYDDQLEDLCKNPVKNEAEIRNLRAMKVTLRTLFLTIKSGGTEGIEDRGRRLAKLKGEPWEKVKVWLGLTLNPTFEGK